MKLAFSTLSCPEWTLAQIIDAASRHGYAGIEFRGLREHLELPDAPDFAPAQIAETRARLQDAGLAAACLSSSVKVVEGAVTPVDQHTTIAHAERYLDLAKEIGAPCIRVFCGNVPATMTRVAALDAGAETLRVIGDFAQARGLTVAVETHDAFIRTDQLTDLLRLANHPAVGVLWDIHHPYRMMGESVEQSMRYLQGQVRYAHVKDSVQNADGEGYTYVALGAGDVPVREALAALKADGYDGYLSLEWEKRWHPSLDPPEVVIPQYAEQMRAWLAEL